MFPRPNVIGSLLIPAVILVASPPPALAQRIRATKTRQSVELHLADDAIIRWQNAPMQFDDKGNPVKPTTEQLKALKGESKQPGYAAEVSDLKRRQKK